MTTDDKKRKNDSDAESNKKSKSSKPSDSTPVSTDSFLTENQIMIEGDNVPDYITNFSDLSDDVSSKILKKLESLKFTTPTVIQRLALPIALSGRDLIGIAETGSGKTLSFMIPALMHIKNSEGVPQKKKLPRVLVMAPTRELALQIEEHTLQVKGSTVSTICVYGGVSKTPQVQKIKQGVDIVIGTPGRIMDLLETDQLDFSKIDYLVLDEADRMLDMGFEPQLKRIFPYIKKVTERQTLMFSATWPPEVKRIASEHLNNPIQITKGSTELTANKNILQIVHVMNYRDKFPKLLSLLKEIGNEKLILFTLYKKSTDKLYDDLCHKGYNSIAIMHGNKSQDQRENALREFHAGTKKILLTTDVCARGMDIKKVKYVINYEYPLTTEDYVHRIGRTGRANELGKAITFFDPEENKPLSRELVEVMIEAGQEIPPELQKLCDSTFARPQRSYLDKLYGGKYEFKTDQKSTHVKF